MKNQGDRIRELFAECGNGEDLESFARRCLEAGLFEGDEEELRMLGAMETVKETLSEAEDDGLPAFFAMGDADDPDVPWKGREELTYDDACVVLSSMAERMNPTG